MTERNLSTRDIASEPERANEADEPLTREDDDGAEREPLLPGDQSREFTGRWQEIQTGFVDEPRRAVEQADELVATAMKHLAESFASERSRLEQQWDRGDQVNTEDLRQALRRYRAFFQRLLTV